jgi:SAM-dependent methyltransferase
MMRSPRRPETSSPALDAAERAWWSEFADVEERFCWAQTPRVQRVLRGHYVDDIKKIARRHPRIIEFGCGSGWLSLQLAQFARADVTGLDWSPEQLEHARNNAKSAGHAGRLRYIEGNIDPASLEGRFDLAIMHGFLHHLSRSEIREATTQAHRVLAPTGRLVAVEPVQYPPGRETPKAQWLIHRQQWLAGLQGRGRRFRWRRYSEAEQAARGKINRRGAGVPPFGPSPKELPFDPDELPGLLRPLFEVERRQRCLSMSHLVAQEYLLLGLSHPWLASLILWPVLQWARHLDRRLTALEPPPANIWVFEMFEARRCPV